MCYRRRKKKREPGGKTSLRPAVERSTKYRSLQYKLTYTSIKQCYNLFLEPSKLLLTIDYTKSFFNFGTSSATKQYRLHLQATMAKFGKLQCFRRVQTALSYLLSKIWLWREGRVQKTNSVWLSQQQIKFSQLLGGSLV